MNFSVRKWTAGASTVNEQGETETIWSMEGIGVTRYPLVVDKEGTTTVNVFRDDLDVTDENTRYSVRITYRRTSTDTNVADGLYIGQTKDGIGTLTVSDGFKAYNANGTTSIHPNANTIDGDTALCLDLTGLGTIPTITPSTNPNCLYLLAAGTEVPNNLSEMNVVVGSSADNITLQDGYDFYSPIDFTATSISYTRTFNNGATGTGGWNTICLPFEVSSVNCEGFNDPIDWFHNANDTEKNFWVRAFTYENNGMANFDFASQMTANTPYIIAVPGDLFDEDYRMTGKNVTFRGSNANITATKTASVSGNNYKFCGSTVRTTLSEVYGLNSIGSTFVKMKEGTTATVPAFRAWFEAVNISSLSRTSLTIGNGTTTGIEMLPIVSNEQSVETSPWYTPSGAKLSKKPVMPGLYINNGKKIVIR
jgi:hypothetical protein